MVTIISRLFQTPQRFVDNLGMYRLVLGSLSILAGISIFCGFLGVIDYGGLLQLFTLALALLVALSLNWVVALITKIPANHESAAITALILFFLTIPESDIFQNWPLVLAVTVAILSKFIVVYKKQHFLNPAAFGAAALSATGVYTFSWWVANPVLFVPLFIAGLLVVMKLRKWVPVVTFVLASLIIYTAESISYGGTLLQVVKTFFTSWPTLFLAFYMLTEPFTMPSMKGPQMLYGGVVGFLSNSSMVSFSPELALVVANLIMLPWRGRQKLILVFVGKRLIAKDTYEFIFKKPRGFTFKAGQYLEWMFVHEGADHKGIRRYFTIASSPTEEYMRLAFKFAEGGSSYKSELMKLDIGEKIVASQLAGDFVLPKEEDKKLGFIAGGIGVTPFRSHIQYMVDTGKVYDTKLLYCSNLVSELAYNDEFTAASRNMAFELVPVIAKEKIDFPVEHGYVTIELLRRRVPDYKERIWYISGPPAMVDSYTKLLKGVGIPKKHIKRDFFPGVA